MDQHKPREDYVDYLEKRKRRALREGELVTPHVERGAPKSTACDRMAGPSDGKIEFNPDNYIHSMSIAADEFEILASDCARR